MEVIIFLKQHVDFIIMWILGIMSFFALFLVIERVLFYSFIKLEKFKNTKELEIACTKNLTSLYVIYQNAPYIGLLGTIAGIMITFYDMANSSNIDANAVLSGLSLALKATAFGICIAVPTLASYNMLNRKVDILLAKFEANFEITTK